MECFTITKVSIRNTEIMVIESKYDYDFWSGMNMSRFLRMRNKIIDQVVFRLRCQLGLRVSYFELRVFYGLLWFSC